MPSKQGPVQGRFKPAHDSAELVAGRPISPGTRVKVSVRRFETPTALSDERAQAKKDIFMLSIRFLSCITLKRSARVIC